MWPQTRIELYDNLPQNKLYMAGIIRLTILDAKPLESINICKKHLKLKFSDKIEF